MCVCVCVCVFNAVDLCSASLNRTSWRTLCHKAAAKFEDARLSALEHRRAYIYTVSQKKTRHQTLVHNFPKC